MKSNPLSIEQARDFCDKNQYIVGDILTLDSEFYLIKNVAVVPHDKINMLLFLELYKEMKDLGKAISFYKGERYNVAIILSKTDETGTEHYRITTLDSYYENVSDRQDIAITSSAAGTGFHAAI